MGQPGVTRAGTGNTERLLATTYPDVREVLVHEMGHLLGYADDDPAEGVSDLMAGTLPLGARRLPWPASVDDFFADDEPLL